MKTKNLTKNIAAVALVVFAANVFAKPMHDGPLPHKPMMQHMVKHTPGTAKLTAKQKAEAREIVKSFRKQVTPIREKLMDKNKMLQDELSQKTIDEDKVHVLVKDIGALQNQLFAARIDTMIQLHKATGLTLPAPRHHNPDVA